MEFTASLAGGLPPLRIAGAGGEGDEEQAVVAPKEIEEHEVDTYREQDVSTVFCYSFSSSSSAS